LKEREKSKEGDTSRILGRKVSRRSLPHWREKRDLAGGKLEEGSRVYSRKKARFHGYEEDPLERTQNIYLKKNVLAT